MMSKTSSIDKVLQKLVNIGGTSWYIGDILYSDNKYAIDYIDNILSSIIGDKKLDIDAYNIDEKQTSDLELLVLKVILANSLLSIRKYVDAAELYKSILKETDKNISNSYQVQQMLEIKATTTENYGLILFLCLNC